MTTATNVRAVRVSAEQMQVVDELATDLVRAGNDKRATTLMAIVLGYKFARYVEEPDDEPGELYVIPGGRADA
jgi:hypothetical protein